jgi:hypothetical protein
VLALFTLLLALATRRFWARIKITRGRIAISLTVVAFGVAMVAAQNWYYTRIIWPRRIQIELLCREMATHSHLLRYEGFSHFGQGAYRRTYRIEPKDTNTRELCGILPVLTCRLERRGNPQPNVQTSLLYEHGSMTIEEAWL